MISPEDIEKIIREHPDWEDGMDIELRICAAASGEDSLLDKMKKLFPDSKIRAPVGNVSPNGWTYEWSPIPKLFPGIPSTDPGNWRVK